MSGGLQPFLSDAVVALRAPTQVWSARDGDLGANAIDGVYHGDTRFVRASTLTYAGADAAASRRPETVAIGVSSASDVTFTSLLRGIDDAVPDPKVRLMRERAVEDGLVRERLRVQAHLDGDAAIGVTLVLTLVPEFAPLQEVKAGLMADRIPVVETEGDAARAFCDGASFTLSAPGATVEVDDADGTLVVTWRVDCPARGEQTVEWSLRMDDPSLVVRGATGPPPWASAGGLPAEPGPEPAIEPRVHRWVEHALWDLDALRLALPDHPDDEFYAAGVPWFYTLFGRDSLWTARLLLPVDTTIAASTLRVLARLQGTIADVATAQEPGKILHELRAGELRIPGEGIVLPPVYYGTVDATPLWVCLLADAAAAGMPDAEVGALVPNLRAALDWIVDSGGEGFLDYVDHTGRGLSNQGWKDSGDSIQWRDGTLAEGPIALCEVQAYAYEAARAGADLLDRLGEPGGADYRDWAGRLRERFRERFWVTTPEGTYPAIALDRSGRPVDTLTSNIGHVVGTGILDPGEEATVARLLVGPTMSSGFGLRTMSTDAAGYWPLSYHGGSVWAHDTAIAVRGLMRAGCRDEALALVDGLLATAEAFAFRVPELHSGDDAADVHTPVPYPAACRPQAWSAAAAVVCLEALRGR